MITIVGNTLNSNNKKVLDKMNKMDFDYVQREVLSQIADGAEFIELNAYCLNENEMPFLKKAIEIIESCGGKVLVRSENVDTLVEVVKLVKNEVMVGGLNYEPEKIDCFLDNLSQVNVNGREVKIVATVKEKNDECEPCPEKSLLIAQLYIDYLLDKGVNGNNIILDPVVKPLGEDLHNGKVFLNTLELFKLDFPQVKTIANLSTFSEGLPMRGLITSHFVSLAIEKGLDYVVLEALEKPVIESIIATLTIIGRDRNMQTFLSFCRNNKESKKRELEPYMEV